MREDVSGSISLRELDPVSSENLGRKSAGVKIIGSIEKAEGVAGVLQYGFLWKHQSNKDMVEVQPARATRILEEFKNWADEELQPMQMMKSIRGLGFVEGEKERKECPTGFRQQHCLAWEREFA